MLERRQEPHKPSSATPSPASDGSPPHQKKKKKRSNSVLGRLCCHHCTFQGYHRRRVGGSGGGGGEVQAGIGGRRGVSRKKKGGDRCEKNAEGGAFFTSAFCFPPFSHRPKLDCWPHLRRALRDAGLQKDRLTGETHTLLHSSSPERTRKEKGCLRGRRSRFHCSRPPPAQFAHLLSEPPRRCAPLPQVPLLFPQESPHLLPPPPRPPPPPPRIGR